MIVGIDEVGRGCWAGPLVAGAVVLRRAIPGLRDSKKLTKKERERLDVIIRRRAVAIGLGWVTPAELDDVGLTQAVRLAMERALEVVREACPEAADIIIDGSYNFLKHVPGSRTMIKADDLVPAVSAASIVAKVARDAYMANEAAAAHPQYAFHRHVGYGTALHRAAIELHGLCDLHRRSFAPVRARLMPIPEAA